MVDSTVAECMNCCKLLWINVNLNVCDISPTRFGRYVVDTSLYLSNVFILIILNKVYNIESMKPHNSGASCYHC